MWDVNFRQGFAGPEMADVIKLGIVSKINLPGTYTNEELETALDAALLDAKRLAATKHSHALFGLELIDPVLGDGVVRVEPGYVCIRGFRIDWVVDQDGNFGTLRSEDLPSPGKFMLTLWAMKAVTRRKGRLRMFTARYNLDVTP